MASINAILAFALASDSAFCRLRVFIVAVDNVSIASASNTVIARIEIVATSAKPCLLGMFFFTLVVLEIFSFKFHVDSNNYI
ncbi:MAG: hypothetical protein ACO3SO_00375 [Luteolibacter sp.]